MHWVLLVCWILECLTFLHSVSKSLFKIFCFDFKQVYLTLYFFSANWISCKYKHCLIKYSDYIVWFQCLFVFFAIYSKLLNFSMNRKKLNYSLDALSSPTMFFNICLFFQKGFIKTHVLKSDVQISEDI